MTGSSLQMLGWVLFVFCALCYIVADIRSGDGLSLAGSILFLAACIVFLAELVLKRAK